MLDEQRGVAMLMIAHQEAPETSSDDALAGEGGIDLAAGQRGAGRELEGLVARVGVELHEPGAKVESALSARAGT